MEPASGTVPAGTKLTLTANSSGVTIYYTTDGSTPTKNSPKYDSPILLDKDMKIKIAAARGGVLGNVLTYSYVVTPSPSGKLGAFRSDAAQIRYLSGYRDGAFRPDQPASRYEVAQALARLVNLDDAGGETPFTDVSAEYAETVAKLVRAGLVNGMTETTFQGEGTMTRSQLSKLLTIALGLETDSAAATPFSDVTGHWAVSYIGALTKAGYIKGYTDGTFRPDRPVTRAELAALLNRAAGRRNVPQSTVTFTDVPTDFWGYQDICDAALE